MQEPAIWQVAQYQASMLLSYSQTSHGLVMWPTWDGCGAHAHIDDAAGLRCFAKPQQLGWQLFGWAGRQSSHNMHMGAEGHCRQKCKVSLRAARRLMQLQLLAARCAVNSSWHSKWLSHANLHAGSEDQHCSHGQAPSPLMSGTILAPPLTLKKHNSLEADALL